MYASYLGDFYNVIAAFESETGSIEHEIQLEQRDPVIYVDSLGISIDAVMVAIRDLETHLASAQDLIRDTQQVYRRLVSGFFCRSRYLDQALKKPRGYAGDFQMLEMLYKGDLAKGGIERALDKYTLDLPCVRAVVNRKDFAKRWLAERLAKDPNARVVDLASGSCRIERELIESHQSQNARFVAIDHDPEALAFCKRLLGSNAERFEFVHENALQIARGRGNLSAVQGAKYCFCLGLYDYLPPHLAVKLLAQMRESLANGAEILVGNLDVNNPNQTFMDWSVDWPLVYRSSHDFFEIFLEAGFAREDVEINREAEGGLCLMYTGKVRRR